MSKLSNPRHEAFCQFVSQGCSNTDAYARAYDREPDDYSGKAGHRLMKNDDICARVSELQQRRANAADVTVESITEELDEAKLLAQQEGQAGAFVQAVMGKAKLHGLITDKVKSETTIKADPDDYEDAELAAIASSGRSDTPGPETSAPKPSRLH